MKSGQGSLSLKAYPLSCQRLHMCQMRAGAVKPKKTSATCTWKGLGDAQAKELGCKVVRAARVLAAIASHGQNPEPIS